MARQDLDTLRGRLLHAGIAPRFVARAVAELGDHLVDIESEAAEHGVAREAAATRAAERLGTIEVIAQQYLDRPEMRSWFFRYPRLARVVFPVAYALLLPALPICAGIRHASALGKWLASLLLGGLVTMAMLLVMQLSIILT
ncbi:MAG: hypothetical protein P8X98_08580 [Woeseiaceae bacterium]